MSSQLGYAPKIGDEPSPTLRPRLTSTTAKSERKHGEAVEHNWAADEALQLIQQIFLVPTDTPPSVVAFSSVNHRNGCSRICAAVAEAMASSGLGSVCLVDANFRTPAVAKMFGVIEAPGLKDALTLERPIRSFTIPIADTGLWLLPAGVGSPSAPGTLAPAQTKKRLEELRKEFRFVMIDLPPLIQYIDAVAVAQHTDGLVVILEAGSTRKESAEVVAHSLRAANIPILGAVLNKRTFPIPKPIYKFL